MKTRKFVLIAIVLFIFSIGLTGCMGAKGDIKEVKVAALNGPTGMGMVKMMKDSEDKSDGFEFETTGAPDDLLGKVISKEVQIAALPTNMASVIYNKTGGEVQLAAINTLGVLYILEDGDEIKDIKDLKGKKLSASGKGATPDFILDYLLKSNGLDPEGDLDIDFSMQHGDLAAAVSEGDSKLALLPEPHVSLALMKNKNLRIALDITKEWEKTAGDKNPLPMGCIVVQKDFAEENPKIMKDFLDKYKKSVDWVNKNPKDAGLLIEKHGILPNADLAESAIPKCNIVYLDGEESKEPMNAFLKVLFDLDPSSIGGKLPDEAFYYTGK